MASLFTEPKQIQPLLESATKRIDQLISQKKLRFVLAAVMASLKGKSGSSAIIHPFELKATDSKTPDAKATNIKAADDKKAVDAKPAVATEVVRCMLRGTEEVEARPLHEDHGEALKELLIRNNWPTNQDYLQPIRGFCAGFVFNNKNYPLTMVVPHIKQGNAIDFFKGPENRGRSSKLLLRWATSLASAIESLHSENLIHGDISARTVLINDSQDVLLAVSDYLCYEQEMVPIRVRRGADKRLSYHLPRGDKTISKTSDIFAFGITLLEIATEGNNSLYDWTVSASDDDIFKTYSNNVYTETIISNKLPSFVP